MKPAAPVTSTRMTAGNQAPGLRWPSRRYRHTFVRADPPLCGPDPRAAPVLSCAMEIDVVLPCLDEASALPWVLSRMPPGYRPIVADNGSTDGSAVIAARYGARVVQVPQRGFGAACQAGLLAASSEIVCVMDADASFDPGDLPAVTGPVLAGDADLVLGCRSARGKGAWPLHARVGNRVLAAELRRRIGVPVRDIGPMRAARREPLLALPVSDRRFGYPLEMVLRAAHAGWRIAETDVPYYPRTGKSKVTGTLGGTVRTVRDMRRVLASVASPASS
jgi:Glycosyl transferase family 2